MSKIECTVN